VAGRGIPLVVVHGFTAEGFMYVQTLSRLVAMGFKVIAVDTAGHGGTQVLPQGAWNIAEYSALLGRVLDELGIRRAVVAGHSMGGRLVAELAAARPDRTIGVLLLDAIVGKPWDRIVSICRTNPALLFGLGAAMAIDTASTIPLARDTAQTVKLGKLGLPLVKRHVRRPWGMVAPAVAILRASSSRQLLERLRDGNVAVFAIHGERDLIVPLSAARDAAEVSGGELIVVRGGSHSWLLRDPETLPAIVGELLRGRLGDAVDRHLAEWDVDRRSPIDDIERALYEQDAAIVAMTPAVPDIGLRVLRRPQYRWSRWSPVERSA